MEEPEKATFSRAELNYLSHQRLGRIATVDAGGRPHIAPTSFGVDPEQGFIFVGGRDLTKTKKYRDVQENPHVALIVDDVVSLNPWRPRAVEIRGVADIVTESEPSLEPGVGGTWIRIRPTRIISWGLDVA